MYNILIVDDSEDDFLLLLRAIKKGGLNVTAKRVDSDSLLKQALTDNDWDVIITDHNIPSYSSYEALDTITSIDPDLPVLIVSGEIPEHEAVELMKKGARDYVMKDNTARLIPAIEREIRESESRFAKKQAEQNLEHMAFHDALTGLANREHFEKCITDAIEASLSKGSEHALMSLDLDQFKIINDTCGHVAGDELLKQISLVLLKLTKNIDTLARLGADEFGILLHDIDKEQANKIAERIQRAVKDLHFTWHGKPYTTSISIGIAAINRTTQSVQSLLSCADMACNAAKEKSHLGIQWFSDTDPEYLQRRNEMVWASKIKQAIEHDRFVLHFQPMQGLHNHCHGAHGEFLVRLEDEGRLVFPGEFIPAAERYKLMPQLDRWVVQSAFKYLSQSGLGHKDDGAFFINLSGSTLDDASFFRDVRALLSDFQIKSERVCFEITETTAINNLKDAVEFISEIRDEGFKFALDDFGAGMSSFSYLKKIPVDYLKVDGSFVQNMLSNAIDRSIVEACNGIGHAAGLQTIAEFVEDTDTANALKTIGVDFAQGFGIAKPGPLR